LYFCFASGVVVLVVVFTLQLNQVLTLYLAKQKYFGGTNARVQGIVLFNIIAGKPAITKIGLPHR
jgi:hypothetical protein